MSSSKLGNRTEELLSEILKWIKFAGSKEVREVLASTLDTNQKRLIYHLSDGRKSSVQIAELAKTSDRTVRRYWESWARKGIVDALSVRGGERYEKAFELEDFGINVPDIQVQSVSQSAATGSTERGSRKEPETD